MENNINCRAYTFFIAIIIGMLVTGCSSRKEIKKEALYGKGGVNESGITVCHKSGKPSGKMFVTKISDLKAPSWDIQLTLICLQGLVNRESPSLFIVQDELDEKWLKWMAERGDIREIEWVSAEQVIEKFAPIAHGIVTVDTLIPATFNVATMLAGINNCLVATPGILEKYSIKNKISNHSETDLIDLRKFGWKKDVEAYNWFYEKYYDQLSHRMCALTDPYDLPLKDYFVEFRIPLLWVNSGLDNDEMDFAEKLLMKLPPNIPCLGWPSAGRSSPDKGMGEHQGVILVNEYAKWQVCSGWEIVSRAVSNLSVHSGTSADIRNPVQVIPKLENKVYISFIRTDGDGPNFYQDRFRKLWDDTTTHGKFAMGWQQGPTLYDLMPDILDWYYKHATPNDYFVNALSGIGYIHEENYAYMYPEDKRKEIWNEYLNLSQVYREKMNLSMLTTYHEMSSEKMAGFTSIGFKGIFANYERSFITSLHNQVTEMNGVPIFRGMVDRVNSTESLVGEIRTWVPRNRPAFVFISLQNWVISLKPIEAALKELGSEYVAVTPEQLVGLYWKSRKR